MDTPALSPPGTRDEVEVTISELDSVIARAFEDHVRILDSISQRLDRIEIVRDAMLRERL